MTVITKPLCQDQKEEKHLDKECFVKVNDSLVVAPGGETIILPEDSTSIPIETSADDSEGERRLSSRKNTSRGILRISQLFLLCTAIFSVAMGLTVAMHSYFTIGHRRQFYRGFCRVPYPSTLIDGMITYDPEWASFGPLAPINNARTEDGTIVTGKSLELGVGLHGDSAIVTGDAGDDHVKRPTKQEEMKKIMERLIQKMVSPQSNEKHRNIPLPVFDGDRVRNDLQSTKALPKVAMNQNQKLLPDGKFELDFDIDLELEREELQMPQLSQGKYLHDFKMNKTAIIDKDEKRCFVLTLNRQDIAPPQTLYDIVNGMMKGSFDIDIEEIRQDMIAVPPAITNFGEYGPVIEHACEGMETFRLVPAHHKITFTKDPLKSTPWEEYPDTSRFDRRTRLTPRRSERSAHNENLRQDAQYQEFAGKFIKYNIINLKEI